MASGSPAFPPASGSGSNAIGIACREVSAGYLGSQILRDISFTIDEPSVYVVLGPNGAGKTTLFRTLSGVLEPYHGEVYIGSVLMGAQGARDRLHYLSHVDGMPDGLRVREALAFYCRAERATAADVERVLDQLEIRELEGRYLSQLSSGQRKRVSIARVFLRERSIYLLDEPTAGLDPKAAREIRNLILELSRNKIVLYSSHNLFEAREIGRYVLVIKNGQLALFDRIENVKGSRFTVGVRLVDPSASLSGFVRQGSYFLRELGGPDEVPPLIHELDASGVKVREVREMDNPLEELFT